RSPLTQPRIAASLHPEGSTMRHPAVRRAVVICVSTHPGSAASPRCFCYNTPMTEDVLIIGAGPAGTATAAFLHQHGVTCRIVERARFPRFVVGESLLPSVMDLLDAAGLLGCVDNRGYQVKPGAKILAGDQQTTIDFTQG